MRNTKISQYEIISAKMTEAKRLYEDLDFPANNNSIGDLQQVLGKIEWKRPKVCSCLAISNYIYIYN